MSEDKNTEVEATEPSNDESVLDSRKELARSMGVEFHPSIGLHKLNEKIQAAIDAEAAEMRAEATEQALEAAKNAAAVQQAANNAPLELSPELQREHVRAKALELVRIRVTCMNPMKKDYEGEFFATGNKVVGTLRKYVHFDVEWHVPRMIYNMIKNKKYQTFATRKVRSESGVLVNKKEGRLVPEYAVEVLPNLTEAELKALAQRQAMAAGTAEG